MHLADFHLGKKVNEFSMIEDQAYILKEILAIIDDENIQVVLIAGDIYDKPIPPIEAVELFDAFLVALSDRDLTSIIISGNHDSAERIAFGSQLMSRSGVYFSSPYNGQEQKIVLEDEYGPINFYLFPFIKPTHVRRYFPEEEIDSYNRAVQVAIQAMTIDTDQRNILLAHQFITGGESSDSERISVGGSENVDAWIFKDFDYVALGHLHQAQVMSRDSIRYAGSPLKYSASEINHRKSAIILEMKEKDNLEIGSRNLEPLRDMRRLEGSYYQLMSKTFADGQEKDDYLFVTLTDEEEFFDVMNRLRKIYPNVMSVQYKNVRSLADQSLVVDKTLDREDPLSLFDDFYEMQNGQKMNVNQVGYLKKLIEEVWEGEK